MNIAAESASGASVVSRINSSASASNLGYSEQQAVSQVVAAFQDPATEPENNQEVCAICLQALGQMAIVKLRCTHTLHAECDNAVVGLQIQLGRAAEQTRCSICRAPRVVMVDLVAPDAATFPPS